ncbi:hypothetical protein K440DRAFT_641397 [Wilcoxina mikolae CBS 423.85]|nr:hypothetical protein K440DRAFT_641397 [Wilcoxina mikolae CBS 423.85]
MTTQAISAPEATTSYAAALASGTVSKPSTSRNETTPASGNTKTLANGISEPVKGMATTPHPVPSEPRLKTAPGGSSSAPEVTRQSTPTAGGMTASRYDDEVAATTADEKSNGWEGNSQTSSHKSSGADTVWTSESTSQPTPNVWKKRQEEFAAKPKNVSPVIPSSVSPAPTSKSSTSETGQNLGKKGDEKKDLDVTKESKDHRKGSDEAPTKRGSRRGQTHENDVPVSLPPPVTDTISWPTPDLAQGEFKKEKDEKEKEKPVPHAGRGGNKTWVPVAIDPPYVPPIQTKTGRGGRGGRGGREGGRGGASGAPHGSERSEKAGSGTSGALEGDRGRQYHTRYQGAKGPKRSSSAGGAVQRRESKTGMTNGTTERRKDASEWAAEAGSSGIANSAIQTDRPRQARVTEDSSDARQYSEGQKSQANGYMHQSRSERGASWYAEGPRDPDSSSPFTTNTSRERGTERGRGGYRGRNYSQFPNGHPNTTHPQNPQFSSPSTSGQQFIQHPQPRGGSYGRRAYNGHAYRFNPTMPHPPAPQFAPAYNTPGLPYEYAMIPSSSLTPVDFAALIHQINYYFSVDNLCKDMYLRKHMDSDGFVRLSFLMGFHRVQLLTKDIGVLREACQASTEIQLQYGLDDYYVRKLEGWENWVLKEEDRDESAKREQSDWHIDPRQRKPNSLTPPGEMSGSAEPFFPNSSAMASMYYPHPISTATTYGYPTPTSTLSAAVPEFSPSSHHGHDAAFNPSVPLRIVDECSDAEVDTLIVVVKRPMTGESASVSSEPSPNRQIPNGVPEVATISEILQGTSLSNGDGAYDEAGRRSQPNGSANHRSHRSQSDIGWFNSPRTGPVAESSMTHRSYTEVHAQALKQRESAGGAKLNNDMVTLYRFWSHFLVKRFNASMYKEFKQFALQDADLSSRHGIEEIFKLYERSFQDRNMVSLEMIRDFVELVKLEARHGESLGIEKLKSILANPSLKDDYKSTIESLVDSDLRGIMTHGVGKKNSRSPAAEPYKSSAMLA